ncbi:unnamed protein product, partial [Polarella glacialis]
VQFCRFDLAGSLEGKRAEDPDAPLFCEGEFGLSRPQSDAVIDAITDNSIMQQVAAMVDRAKSVSWQLRHVHLSLDNPHRATFLLLAQDFHDAGHLFNFQRRPSDELLENAEDLFRWYGQRMSVDPNKNESIFRRTEMAHAKGRAGKPVLHRLDDLIRSAHLLWGVLYLQAVREPMAANKSNAIVFADPRFSSGLETMWDLEPGSWRGCETCESRWGWKDGSSVAQRNFKAVDACGADSSEVAHQFPAVALDPTHSVYGRVIGISYAEISGHASEIEWISMRCVELRWMVDFYTGHQTCAASVGALAAGVGVGWEMDVARLACHFEVLVQNGLDMAISHLQQQPRPVITGYLVSGSAPEDGRISLASVVAPVSASNHDNGGDALVEGDLVQEDGKEELTKGAQLLTSLRDAGGDYSRMGTSSRCSVPDGLELPLRVQVWSKDHQWLAPLEVHLCEATGVEPVELGLCTRSVFDMGPETSQLTDGSGVHTVDKFPPGFVDRQPFFEGRGDRIWFDKLERENRWNWNLTNFYPRMGCVIHQLNHCLMRARGRAKYLLMVRALDKFFTVNFDHQITDPPIERFLEKIRAVYFALVMPANLSYQSAREHKAFVSPLGDWASGKLPNDQINQTTPRPPETLFHWNAFDSGLRDRMPLILPRISAEAPAGLVPVLPCRLISIAQCQEFRLSSTGPQGCGLTMPYQEQKQRVRFLHFAVTSQVYGGNGHVLWTREGTIPGVVPRDEFWMSHYLRAFDTTPEAQTKDPGKRWRFRFCDTLNPATDLADLAHIRQHSCADLGSDGGVAAEHHSALYRRLMGKVQDETDPDMLATASYDGHLKVWQISTSETHRDMFAGKDMLLYGLAFGPGAAKICAVSSTGFLLIWKLDNGEQLVRQQLHTGQAYRCEWSSKGAGQIATGGADGIACVVDPATGNSVNRIVHPQPVYGVAWHPSQEGILATGCQDGHVRIFNLLQAPGTVDPKAQVVMKGHEARVFNIVFHPVCPNIIASGSDDKTIRIWNWSPTFTGQRELRKLTGHTSHVRGLLWNTELPHILFTGSWDSTIRVWDVAESRCLYVSHDHHADVYGLSLHPRRPFFLVSSSRDTTIRFWIFEDIVRPLLVQALLHPESLSDLLGDSVQEASLAMESPVGQVPVPKKLFGKASRALATELQTLGAARPVSLQAYQKLLNFFMYRQGMEDLWGLVSQIRGETLPSAPGAHRSFFHEREMVACQKSKALELASTRAQIGIAGKQEERLLKAAQIMCRVGDLRAYCRLTAQAGHWERAICIAPAVSHQFWQELCAEYMDTLSAATDTEEVAPFLVGIGRASRLVDSYIERSELDSAFVVAKADCDGLLPCASSSSASSAPPPPPNPSARARLEDVAGVLAQRHLEQGEPLQAAMCFLAVSQPSRAVRTLARAQEVMLAFALSDLLGEPQDPVFLKLISQCAERDDRLELAAEILQMHPQGPSVHLPLLAARAKDQAGVRPWAPWTVEQHQERLAAALEVGDRPAAVLSAVCGGPATHTQAVQLGVEGLCELFARPGGWSLCEARALLDPLESVAIQDMGVKEIASSLACAAYVGLVEASMMGLHELMFPLAQTLRNIITHQNLQFPVSTAEISLLEASCTSHRAPAQALQQLTSLLEGSDLPPNLRAACEQQAAALRQRAPADEWPDVDGPGLAMMAGGHLPACYKRFAKTSVLTNQRIKGPAFQLEDRKMHVSLSDALAWARVNAFSPLNTGCKIYPI